MIKIGTDCSGIEAPIEALKQLGVEYEHKWSCDNDPYVKKSIMANYTPELFYEDIRNRNHSELPDVDLYVCGFPCQSFSLMGKKKGMEDPRGLIMFECIDTIKVKLPKVFILENVRNFKTMNKGEIYNILIKNLEDIGEYKIYSDIYNTKNYGIPQNRERLFIIGIRRDCHIKEYQKPGKISVKPLEDFILDKQLYETEPSPSIKKNLLKSKEAFIITPFNYFFPIKDVCPTLTTQCHCYYVKKYNRVLSIEECLLLQGFKKDFIKKVSNTQLYKQIGNSMSVNVVKEIINEALKCVT